MNFIRIIVPPLFCAFNLLLYKSDSHWVIYYFSLLLGIFNWKYHKFNPFLSVFLNVAIVVITYWIAFIGFFMIPNILDPIVKLIFSELYRNHFWDVFFYIYMSILSPLLFFYGFKFIYNIPKTKKVLIIKYSTIAVLFINCFLIYNFKNLYVKLHKDTLELIFIAWQIIVVLGLQLMIQPPVKNEEVENK